PIGLVYIAIDNGRKCEAVRFKFGGDRSEVRHAACVAALKIVLNILK
ncbi:MAG: CinA family protein, partial [Lentisphaerae bacterium]|nr:CinA family protein [Lentisphaerota bacterium]